MKYTLSSFGEPLASKIYQEPSCCMCAVARSGGFGNGRRVEPSLIETDRLRVDKISLRISGIDASTSMRKSTKSPAFLITLFPCEIQQSTNQPAFLDWCESVAETAVDICDQRFLRIKTPLTVRLWQCLVEASASSDAGATHGTHSVRRTAWPCHAVHGPEVLEHQRFGPRA